VSRPKKSLRALGVDYGQKRIGVAVSDPLGIAAHPVGVVAGGDDEEAARQLAEIARERETDRVVLGLPLNMDGSTGPQAKRVLRFAKTLRRQGLKVDTYDERLSSREADERLRHAGLRDWRKRKRRIDQAAACVILEGWLRDRAPRG